MRRRHFLKVTAAFGGLIVSMPVYPMFRDKTLAVASENIKHAFSKLLFIASDGTIQVILSKVELGQGISTTLAMLVAEELDCDWKKVTVAPWPTGTGKDFEESPYVLSTGGSDSTRSEFERYRRAGATARRMLLEAAAKRWNTDISNCKTENGSVHYGNQALSFGDLADEAARLPVPTVSLSAKAEWKIIGKPTARLDLSHKVNGTAMYGIDVHFPGLLTAVVLHRPAFGAKLASWDGTRARAINGVREVVEVPEGIAVLADNFWSAKRGRDALDVQWDFTDSRSITSHRLPSDYRAISNQAGRVSQEKGNVSLIYAQEVITFEFDLPFLSHSPMETLNCTVRPGVVGCEIWCGTQSPVLRQMEVAKFLNCAPEDVKFHTPWVGGGFGRRGSFGGDWVMEAVHIAKATGKPIKLVWTREDDIKGGYYRPVYYHKALVSVNEDGTPKSWGHHVVGQSLFENTPLEKDIVVDGIDYSSIGGVQGSAYFDSIPDYRVELHTTRLNLPVIPWRSVSHTHTAFVMETIVDELAVRAHRDPVEYRRQLLKGKSRLLGVLNLAAEKSGWHEAPLKGRYRGIAVHPAMNSYVCQVVELSVEGSKPKIHRVVCAIDCGIAVNPEGIRAQMESGIIYGLTAALYGKIDIEDGRVKQSNFNDYRMLRINECPDIEVHIISGGSDVGGVGEPGVPPIAPALGNALYAATGKRIRELPFRLE
ncbi:xanthine dehydrogenase family protein molybdopterin-binding subunit [Chryseolinea sp. T2]|uniref:xanthine dehydrogenase family protein molybdopterin-binding subunit n=1 Tax=Chryseolinea sp. T2 TaxID=3129255 RepID=UPI003078648B